MRCPVRRRAKPARRLCFGAAAAAGQRWPALLGRHPVRQFACVPLPPACLQPPALLPAPPRPSSPCAVPADTRRGARLLPGPARPLQPGAAALPGKRGGGVNAGGSMPLAERAARPPGAAVGRSTPGLDRRTVGRGSEERLIGTLRLEASHRHAAGPSPEAVGGGQPAGNTQAPICLYSCWPCIAAHLHWR